MSDAIAPSPPPNAPSPAPAKKTNGCLLAAGIVIGIAVLCTCTGVGVMSYVAYTRPDIRRGIGALGEAVTLAENGMKDPGARALVRAGCQQAVAMRIADALALGSRLAPPDGGPQAIPKDAPELVVTCNLRDLGKTCDELARTFVSAHVPAPSSFLLVAQTFPGGREICSNVYGSSGELLGPARPAAREDGPHGPASPEDRAPSK